MNRLVELLAALATAKAEGRKAGAAHIQRVIYAEFPMQPGPGSLAPPKPARHCARCGAEITNQNERFCDKDCAAKGRAAQMVTRARPAALQTPTTAEPIGEGPWRIFFAELPTICAMDRGEAERVVERKKLRYAEIHCPDTGEYFLWLEGKWHERRAAP